MESSPASVQHFNLRWNNHTNNILQVFAEHLCNESLVDVTLSCQGKFLKAHKMVLSACSPYFQELFEFHQVPHPVIIINGMTFLDIKLVIDFMYHGEVKVEEGDLGGLLLAAETLQVKGLANVRHKYEQGQIQKSEDSEDILTSQITQDSRIPTESMERGAAVEEEMSLLNSISQAKMEPCLSAGNIMDDDLPSTIKVEPPDIRDIDEEPVAGWDSPKLIIDMKESKETITELNRLECVDRKRPNILRPSYRVAQPHSQLSDEDSTRIKKEPQEISSSAKCFLLSKRQPKLLGTWGRQKICRIPRPPNAFMIFANNWRKKLASKFPVESNKDISVRLGTMWKNLDADTKELYYSQARKADEEHKQKYPGYYYSPKEARLRKGLKQRKAYTSPPIDALRFVKVYMTNAEKSSLIGSGSTSLLRKLQPKVENDAENNSTVMPIEETTSSIADSIMNTVNDNSMDTKVEEMPLVVDSL